MCSTKSEYNKPRRRPGATPPVTPPSSPQPQQLPVGPDADLDSSAPLTGAKHQPAVGGGAVSTTERIQSRGGRGSAFRRLHVTLPRFHSRPNRRKQQSGSSNNRLAALAVILLACAFLSPMAIQTYASHREWEREWNSWEVSTQSALVMSLPTHVAFGLPAPPPLTKDNDSNGSSRRRRRLDLGDNGAGGRQRTPHSSVGSGGSASSMGQTRESSAPIDFDALGRRRDELVRAARDAASQTVDDSSGRYPPPPPTSQSLHPTAHTPAGVAAATATVPVLGVTVHVDPQRFLPRLLYSVDSPVDAIVVTWYGDDEDVADGIRSFLGDRFVPVANQDGDSFDGTAVVSRFRLKRIADWDTTGSGGGTSAAAAPSASAAPAEGAKGQESATTTTSSSSSSVDGNSSPTSSSASGTSTSSAASIPCREFVILRYPTNLGCSVGFNNPILLYPTAPYWLLVNYDVAYPPGVLADIGRMTDEALRTHPSMALHTYGLVYGRGHVANPWSNFAVTARSVARVGLFDENIFPSYYEDDDYRDRVRHVLGTAVDESTGVIRDDGIIVKRNDRSVSVVHGPIDAKRYVSGNDQVMKINPVVRAQWRAYNAIAENGRYFKCKHGGMPRFQLLGLWEVGADVDRYFARGDRYAAPFGDALSSWDDWTFNATRRRCVHDGVELLVPLSGLARWQKARELAEKCSMC